MTTTPKSEFERELEDFAKFNRDNSVDSGMSEETAMYYGVLHGARWALDRIQTKADLLERKNEELKSILRAAEPWQEVVKERDRLEAENRELKAKLAEVDPLIPKALAVPGLIAYRDDLATENTELKNHIENYKLMIDEFADAAKSKAEENQKLRAALVSISKNSCCDTCQEAKLVALKALGGEE